uniref:Uncharacterized protein n=1 Tax=Rhizophora mucronata TaxID=61149 RepID=A0A2P2KHR4_RHIMU
MQRGSSRLKASIFLISSSNPLTKPSSFETFSDTSPITDTSLRKPLIVLGIKVSLKSRLSSGGGSEPISSFSPQKTSKKKRKRKIKDYTSLLSFRISPSLLHIYYAVKV